MSSPLLELLCADASSARPAAAQVVLKVISWIWAILKSASTPHHLEGCTCFYIQGPGSSRKALSQDAFAQRSVVMMVIKVVSASAGRVLREPSKE